MNKINKVKTQKLPLPIRCLWFHLYWNKRLSFLAGWLCVAGARLHWVTITRWPAPPRPSGDGSGLLQGHSTIQICLHLPHQEGSRDKKLSARAVCGVASCRETWQKTNFHLTRDNSIFLKFEEIVPRKVQKLSIAY